MHMSRRAKGKSRMRRKRKRERKRMAFDLYIKGPRTSKWFLVCEIVEKQLT